MNYYVYEITEKATGMKYIGSRSSDLDPIEDLGVKYFSSSKNKEFVNRQKSSPNNFVYTILKQFDVYDDMLEYEVYLHELYNVSENQNFYNQQNQRKNGFTTYGRTVAVLTDDPLKERITVYKNDPRFETGEIVHFMKGYKHSEETRKNVSDSKLGTTMSLESREKLSKALTGLKRDDEFKKRISEISKGKEKSVEHRKALSEANKGKKWFHDKDLNSYCLDIDDPLINEMNLVPGIGKRAERIIDPDVKENQYKIISEKSKGKKWFHNPNTFEKAFVHPCNCPIGYEPGMGPGRNKKR